MTNRLSPHTKPAPAAPARYRLASLIGALAASAPLAARAQTIDTNPPLPNVLLLVDNSGSMEFMAAPDPITGKVRLPTCNAGNPALTNEQNRWTTLVSVLTGTFQNFSCYPEARSSSDFGNEFGLGTGATPARPYDANYYLPFNRAVSNSCVVGPDRTTWPPTGTNAAYQFPSNVVKNHNYTTVTQSCNGFSQNTDGLLDAFKDRARFGLMTFDASTDPGTGLTSGNADFTSGAAGLWSYFPNWQTSTSGASVGRPEACATNQNIEVGARNAAAPPWEGRMIPFGDPGANQSAIYTTNDHIQNALLMMRPYGATPMAGMMSDAQYFLLSDASLDPLDTTNSGKEFGPKDDPLVQGGCRKNYIILLTDGLPNLDLRPSCTKNPPAPNGTCPYLTPEDTAYALAHPGSQNLAVQTFVIGFALSSTGASGAPSPIDCSSLTPTGTTTFDPNGYCANPTTDQLKACCELGRISFSGGTQNPHFTDNADTLRAALNDILSQVSSTSTSRTTPVFANISTLAASSATAASNAPGISYNFYSSFFVSTGALWQGVLERQRYVCQSDPSTGLKEAVLQPIDPTKGDSFSANVDNGAASRPRQIYSVNLQVGSGQSTVDATQTVRFAAGQPTTATPARSGDDGIGVVGGSPATNVSGTVSALLPQISPQTMALVMANGSSTCSSATDPSVSPSACRDRILGWDLGIPQTIPNGVTYSRAGNVFGSIYHSTPTVVGAPNDFLRDESYTAFQQYQAARPLVLYTATTDGQMHAFQVAPANASDPLRVDSQQNNELWSFIPPAVLPKLRSLYPGVQQTLLDGPPVVRDVVLARTSSNAQNPIPGTPSSGLWSTQMVAGFGSGSPGFFALDVTNPVPTQGSSPPSGPLFRWQITTDESGNPLFGGGGTPAIATVFLVPPGQSAAQEIAVAILPGGRGSVTNGACGRSGNSFPATDPNWPARTQVNCYAATDPSRSLTVVRLDNGELLRTFRAPAGLAAAVAQRTTTTTFSSPMSGFVVPYPSGTGVLSNRAYLGDQDGTVWRLDMRDTNPANWTVDLFFDTYSGLLANAGQPIATPPALSVDPLGNVVVAISTGDQEQFTATTGLRNIAWSVTEQAKPGVTGAGSLQAHANWHLGRGTNESIPNLPNGASLDWSSGERVTGPMTIFNGIVYFSSFRPAPSGTLSCAAGQSTLWGVDYLKAANGSTNGDGAPMGRLVLNTGDPNGPQPPAPDPTTVPPAQVQTDGSIIFGVGLTRTPPCYDTSTVTDPFLGYGTATSVGNLNSGTFQLVVQTGNKGQSAMGGKTNTKSFNLTTPATTVRIDSWAAVVE